MKNVSEKYLEKMQDGIRTFIPRMSVDGVELDGDIQPGLSINLGSCGPNEFTIGNVYIPYITASIAGCSKALQDKEILLEMGLVLTDGTVEYKKMGYFTVEKPLTDKFQTSFTAYGRLMSKAGGLFQNTLSYPTTIQSVIDAVSTQTGLTIIVNGLNTTGTIEKQIVGEVNREVLMRIAGLLGGFVTEDGEGRIVISKYALNSSVTVDTDFCYSWPETNDAAYTVTGIEVIVREDGADEEGNTIAGEKYKSDSVVNVRVQNPYMTESLFKTCESNIVGFSYMPAKVEFLGDISLDPWDSIFLTDENPANGISIPCMNIVHTWDGGLVTTITAPGETETETSSSFGGPLSSIVEKTYQKLLIAEKLIANKVSAEYVAANYASIKKLEATDSYIEKLEAGMLTAENLKAEIANLKYVNADDLAAERAEIDKLFAGYVKANEILTSDINSATGSFSKYLTGVNIVGDLITAGTISTERLVIMDKDTNKGILFAINDGIVSQEGLSEDELKRLTLNGQVIAAQSITADKINVTDLFAQDIKATGSITGAKLYGAHAEMRSGKLGFLEIRENGLWSDLSGDGVGDFVIGKNYFIMSAFELDEDYNAIGDSLARLYLDSRIGGRAIIEGFGRISMITDKNLYIHTTADNALGPGMRYVRVCLDGEASSYVLSVHGGSLYAAEGLLVSGDTQIIGDLTVNGVDVLEEIADLKSDGSGATAEQIQQITNQMVTKENLYKVVTSSNIFDFSTLQVGYLAGVSGGIYTGGSYDNYMYSEMYIPVNEGDVISFQCNVGTGARFDSINSSSSAYCIYCVAGYDANKTFVTGWSNGAAKSYTIPAGVSYIRVCFQASLINNSSIKDKAVVKNSNGVAIPYEPYGEYMSEIIKEEHLPKTFGNTGGNTGSLYVSLTDSVHVKTNNTFKVYYRNIISRKDTMLWVGYHNSLTTRYYDEYFTVSASAEGEYELPWEVYDYAGNLLESGTLTVIATSKVPTDTTTALVIGDSTVNDGTMTAKVADLYTADGAVLSLLGTRGGATHEGRGGWTAEMYCTVASSGGIENPFYNNGFDFSYYMANQGYNGVQAVVIQLGINDIFAFKNYSWAAYDSATVLGYINQMVTSILEYNAGIKVIINLPITPNSNGTSFTETYGTTQLYWYYNQNIIRFAKELREYFKSNTRVTISASNCILDTKTQIRDGVHPTTEGYNALGQRLYEVLISVVDGEVVIIPLLDISIRTRVKHTGASVAATSTHSLDTTKCYDAVFNGTRSDNTSNIITSYNAISSDSLSIQVSSAGGTGMEFPVALEVGKTYTLKYKVDNTGRVYVMKYNPDTTYNSNTMLSSTAGTYTKTITPEAGYLYSIIFVPMVKATLVTFSGISLEEN